MAKDKDRAPNPATAQRRAEKQKALKKSKAALAAQRTERYASRNPARLERTIEALKAERDAKGGKLGGREQKLLEDAERDLGRVRKAREVLGDKGGGTGGRGRGDGGERGGRGRGEGGGRGGYMGLGKRGRGRDGEEEEEEGGGSTGSETDESVRKIPWPRDTPPPIPSQQRRRGNTTTSRITATNANNEPLGASRMPPYNRGGRIEGEEKEGEEDVVPDTSLPLPPRPAMQAKTTYESAPVVRDLRKEATERFVPAAVRRKIEAKKGRGGRLLEEEEVEKLEVEGYGGGLGGGGNWAVGKAEGGEERGRRGGVGDKEGEKEKRRLEEEEERFRREVDGEMEMGMGDGDEREGVRGVGVGVEMEEISDEDL